jgi:hypothetical protein
MWETNPSLCFVRHFGKTGNAALRGLSVRDGVGRADVQEGGS